MLSAAGAEAGSELRTIHHEITGAGRIDYQFNPSSTEGPRGDPHGVVKILTIDFGSH